jgi:hypothetical protein
LETRTAKDDTDTFMRGKRRYTRKTVAAIRQYVFHAARQVAVHVLRARACWAGHYALGDAVTLADYVLDRWHARAGQVQ